VIRVAQRRCSNNKLEDFEDLKRRAKPPAGSKMCQDRFCGVYTSLAEDIKGHARLARGEIIIETFKAVNLAIDLILFKPLGSCICSGNSKEEKSITVVCGQQKANSI
jgi:hypothetical protein